MMIEISNAFFHFFGTVEQSKCDHVSVKVITPLFFMARKCQQLKKGGKLIKISGGDYGMMRLSSTGGQWKSKQI